MSIHSALRLFVTVSILFKLKPEYTWANSFDSVLEAVTVACCVDFIGQ